MLLDSNEKLIVEAYSFPFAACMFLATLQLSFLVYSVVLLAGIIASLCVYRKFYGFLHSGGLQPSIEGRDLRGGADGPIS